MFWHNVKYTFRTLFRNRVLLFWTFAFPIILGTFFQMAFSNIENSEKLSIIDIAIVENETFAQHPFLKETFQILSDETREDRLFHTQYVSLDEAKSLLAQKDITGYLIFEEEPKVVVATSGIYETILKYVTEEVLQSEVIVKDYIEFKQQGSSKPLLDNWYQELYTNIQKLLEQNKEYVVDTSSTHLSYTMIEFYTLIAMACLYGGILALITINQNLANMSMIGKRMAVTPVSKGKLILSSVLASYVTQIFGVALLFLYTIFVLKVDYGNHLLWTIAFAGLGCFAGLAMGLVVATIFRTNENMKTGILLAGTMFGCFLSGMMGVTMKYLVDTNVPLLNKINPASMITDGFYALYYYETFDRFLYNAVSLFLFSMLFIGIAIIFLRRQKYDSL